MRGTDHISPTVSQWHQHQDQHQLTHWQKQAGGHLLQLSSHQHPAAILVKVLEHPCRAGPGSTQAQCTCEHVSRARLNPGAMHSARLIGTQQEDVMVQEGYHKPAGMVQVSQTFQKCHQEHVEIVVGYPLLALTAARDI